jgi:hypothetical protein
MSQIPEMTPIESSNITHVGHDPSTNTLHVRFKSGGNDAHWSYADVPPEKHREMMDAPSKGSFFARNIKGKHTAARIDPLPKYPHHGAPR